MFATGALKSHRIIAIWYYDLDWRPKRKCMTEIENQLQLKFKPLANWKEEKQLKYKGQLIFDSVSIQTFFCVHEITKI